MTTFRVWCLNRYLAHANSQCRKNVIALDELLGYVFRFEQICAPETFLINVSASFFSEK
jgi:hypothetical protein